VAANTLPAQGELLTLNHYQSVASITATYPETTTSSLQAIAYCTLGLTGEAGEIANKVKKLIRDGDSEVKRKEIVAELGDVLWYLSQLAMELQQTLGEVAAKNLDKLADRKVRGVISGSGDTR
jgi:NTP pyrophosphatase (non-canonical NTP hydrolase)